MVEEVWESIVVHKPEEKRVIEKMARGMFELQPSWIDDPLAFVFQELLLKKPIQSLTRPPKEVIEAIWRLDDASPALSAFLNARWDAKENFVKGMKTEQDSLRAPNSHCFVESKTKFFQDYIRPKFLEILEAPERKARLLENVIGQHLRERYPKNAGEIDSAIVNYGLSTFQDYLFTLNYLMVTMSCFYGPLFRIGKERQSNAPSLIGHHFKEQINNVDDKKYLVSAMMCRRLLTCDQDMASMMDALTECELWPDGRTILLKRAKLQSEIPAKLI